MLVPFPLAFWLRVPLFDLLALSWDPQPWGSVALAMTAACVATGLFALVTGLLDYIPAATTCAWRLGMACARPWCGAR